MAQPTEKTSAQNHHRFFERHERRTSSLCHPLPPGPPTQLPNGFVSWPWMRVALSEFGFAYLHQIRLFKGFEFPKAGADTLERQKEANPGPCVRAMRKLAVGYTLTVRLPMTTLWVIRSMSWRSSARFTQDLCHIESCWFYRCYFAQESFVRSERMLG